MNIDLWKKRKKELKLTHDKLSELSGISRRTIAGIFGGDPRYASPTYNTIQSIEKALGIDESISVKEYEQGIVAKIAVTVDEQEILDKARIVLNKHGNKGKDLILNYFDILLNN